MSQRPYYDPYDAEIDMNPHPVWRRLRDEAPLYYNEEYDFYALSRYEDVLAASLDWPKYSSARGTVLEMIDTSPALDGYSPFGTKMMIFMDPPPHDELRKLVSRAFTPRRVAALEGRTREMCRDLLAAQDGSGGFDYLDDFAARIPVTLISALLGVPVEDQDQLRLWADLMLRYEPEGLSQEKLEGLRAFNEYMEAFVRDRQAHPRDDMASDLARTLEFDEVMAFVTLLQVAGTETTARLLGWAAVLLARHPDQRAKLVESPDLIPNAVEELLRYEAPSPIQARFVTEDVEWHGQTVPSHSKIALLTGSAGRDDRKYPDADRFDVERVFDRHVTFGYGIHFCLGANLARLESRVVIDETLAHMPEWDVDESKVEFVRTSTVRGPARVPITR